MHRPLLSCVAAAVLLAGLATSPRRTAGQTFGPESSRGELMAALERLMATGEPHHTTHDDGQRLQLAVDEAIARGDREVEKLAIRAASPLTASISPPVSSTRSLPSLGFSASTVLRVRRPVPYTAKVFASLDGGDFAPVLEVRSGRGEGAVIGKLLGPAAALPGFHAVHLRAELTFGPGPGGTSWIEQRTLRPVFYAVYDSSEAPNGPIRSLVERPARTPVREFDASLGDEPLAVWLRAVLSDRQADGEYGPDWLSDYCDELTREAGSKAAPTSICSVVYFQSRGRDGQAWFRTADIRETEHGTTWVPLAPPRFEGILVFESAPESRLLSALPSLLDAPAWSVPDVSVLPADIVVTPSPSSATAWDVTVTVRNNGRGDLFKVAVDVSWGWDLLAQGASRLFVVDLPSHDVAEIKLQVALPAGYGFIVAHAMQVTEHSPSLHWTPDPTPEDACAVRVVNAEAAPPGYMQSILQHADPCPVG